MSTQDFITELFCRVDDVMHDVPKHNQASLYPSEVVTLALLFAIKGVGNRAFYRWVKRDYLSLFPALPERTRLFRLFATHQEWSALFMADPTVLGVVDTYGIELLHPWRYERTANQVGRKGFSNHKWIVGGKLCMLLNKWGLVVNWGCATANVHDSTFHPVIAQYKEEMIVLADQLFSLKEGNPTNVLVCERGKWNCRMMIETVLSMLHTICHIKQMAHRVWVYFQARLAFTMAAFNLLAQWDGPAPAGLHPDEQGRVHLSIAEFSL
jgi:hypothetical protein